MEEVGMHVRSLCYRVPGRQEDRPAGPYVRSAGEPVLRRRDLAVAL